MITKLLTTVKIFIFYSTFLLFLIIFFKIYFIFFILVFYLLMLYQYFLFNDSNFTRIKPQTITTPAAPAKEKYTQNITNNSNSKNTSKT